MIQIRPVTQSQFLLTLSPFGNTYWTSFSGLRDTAATSTYPDGTRQRIYQLKGPKTTAEATFSVPFDVEKHAEIIDFYKADTCSRLTASVVPVSCGENPQPLGSRTLFLLEAQITSLSGFETDRSSANPSILTLTLVYDDFTYA
jgi:hypothetical protein